MQYPTLYPTDASRQTVEAFLGYEHRPRISEGAFYDMENLTGDHYPVLSPRGARGVYYQGGSPAGLIAKDALCYVDGADFVMNEYRVDMHLSEEGPKQLVSMGAYVVILPDKKWINTMDLTDHGNIEASFTSATDVTFTLCSGTGQAYTNATVSATAPSDPENLDLWIDTSAETHSLKQYSQATGMWSGVAATYVKITAVGIGKAFSRYDGVTISGITEDQATDLNGAAVIWDKGDDYILVVGMLDQTVTQGVDAGAVTVKRTMPDMDFVTEAGNRLWGCRYGVAANGEVVNEIYGSKLGDFKNWNCSMHISTDSWVGSVGTDGPFTGAATHLGYPVFFKENCLHKVYISSAGAHQIQDTACRGVQKGCPNSLAIVNEVLFYKSRNGICAYDGSLPAEVSYALGNVPYHNAVAGAVGNKYYVSMEDQVGGRHLFVYDTVKGLWHRESGFHALCFCCCDGELYAIDADTRQILTMLGSGEPSEGAVQWFAETGDLELSSPDRKYISRLAVRMWLELGAQVELSAQYDHSGQWVQLCCLRGTSLRSFTIPVKPRRCDHLKLRFRGKGMAKIYAITKTVEQGSDVT